MPLTESDRGGTVARCNSLPVGQDQQLRRGTDEHIMEERWNSMTQLTAVSLFAGVGGFDLALERNGVNVVAAVEIDANARGVLRHRFPNTTLFNDVMEVTGEQLRDAGFDGDNGIIVGGFPCQDLSVAGRRAGLEGARSGLFWQICRLLDETKAKFFVLENVPGLLSSNDGRDMGAVIGALVDRGYGVAYRILDAQHFGVAQRRRRVFIVGSLGTGGGAHLLKYSISSKAAEGILRRATRRGKTLPEPLHNALLQVATSFTN